MHVGSDDFLGYSDELETCYNAFFIESLSRTNKYGHNYSNGIQSIQLTFVKIVET